MKAWALPQVDETRCTLCGLCVEACPCHAVKLGERGPIFSCPEVCPSPSTCPPNMGGCCVCEEICPTAAITYAFEIVLEADQDEDVLSGG
ncbi:MAG TPA: 4Fe-4S ferredoxin [Anaerolineae bacterium]|nr:4Fe-4S ferredoxin [Anaerolineae bacterium]